jgi:hypothetical protein
VAVAQADIVAIAPEFATLAPAVFTQALADAALVVAPGFWGARTDMAMKYMAAHIIALSNPDLGLPGFVKSESVGDIRRDYAVMQPATDGSLSLTRWGQHYKTLARMDVRGRIGVI